MRKICLTMLMILSFNSVFAQEKAFEKYADMKDATYVYITKLMLQMTQNIMLPGLNAKSIKDKIDIIQVITAQKATSSPAKQLSADAKKIFSGNGYELMMSVDNTGNKAKFFGKPGKKKNDKSMMGVLIEQPAQTVVVVLTGTFTPEDIQSITNN